MDVRYVGAGLHSAQRRMPAGWSCSCCNAAGRVARRLGLLVLVLVLVLLVLFMLELLLLQLRKAGLSP